MPASHRTPSGASSAAFSTSVLPAQRAGAILSAARMTGAFQGMMAPTTPIGSRRVYFVAQLVACAASFYAHVFFDKEYHIEGSRLQRFAWFRRKQELHFVHHTCNVTS